ncbi:MAG: UDP-N-acetylmuramoyl-L-alanine--D-glutamate ligase [Patescibacteria group bacterium UBA2103]
MFSGKRVTVMGLGLLGRGVGDAAYLAEQGAEVLVTDLKSKEELQVSVDKLSHFSNISFVLGEHRLEDFEDKDFILKGNGVPLQNKYIEHAQSSGVPIEMSGALFHAYAGIPMIGVTGTRGKSTITELIHHVLGSRSLLGGNIRGVSNLQLLKEVEGKEVATFELDSWQLQGFGYRKISPQVAVFSNFMEDHLNYYGDMDTYFMDKAQIFLHQKEDGVLIVGEGVEDRIKEYRSDYIVAKKEDVDFSWVPGLVGEHNHENVACAYHALKMHGLSDEEIKKGFLSFAPVEGRLQFVGEYRGVKVFNDNNATTPTATAAGIAALKGEGRLIAIIGGADKGLDVSPLVDVLGSVDHVILLAGSGTEKLGIGGEMFDDIEKALASAFSIAEECDTILFSPGFASFGMFQNEYERNDAFMQALSHFE